jgi:hypothetical protein
MKTRLLLTAAFTLLAVVLVPVSVSGQGHMKARLTGYQEVPPVSTPAGGWFVAKIDRKTGAILWELSYSGLASGVTEAHIHFGQPGVNGGVIAFLCTSSLQNRPIVVPICPEAEGTVAGEIDRGSIIGPAEQGIEAGELGEALRAIFSGLTYVNVHTNAYPANESLGEIRGQIRRGFAGRKGYNPFADPDDVAPEESAPDPAVDRNRDRDESEDED